VKGVVMMDEKERKEIEALIDMRNDHQNWLSGEELQKEAMKSFQQRKDLFRYFLDNNNK